MADRYTRPNPALRDWALRELLRFHRGRAQAITWNALAEKARAIGHKVLRDNRNLREEVTELQLGPRPGALICTSSSSSNEESAGVFVATCNAEFDAYQRELVNGHITSLARKLNHQRFECRQEFGLVTQLRLTEDR